MTTTLETPDVAFRDILDSLAWAMTHVEKVFAAAGIPVSERSHLAKARTTLAELRAAAPGLAVALEASAKEWARAARRGAKHDPGKARQAYVGIVKLLVWNWARKRAGLAAEFLHGTRAHLKPGDLIKAGHASNYGKRDRASYVYLTGSLDTAAWGAELAVGKGPGRIYAVEPTGRIMPDPDLTWDGTNPTKSYRSLRPLRVTAEVTDWTGHAPELVKSMKDAIARLAAAQAPDASTLSDDDRREVGLWAADCAEHVLPLFETKAPVNTRPRAAIAGIRAFARGELRVGELRAIFSAAYAAARDVAGPAAAAAARAAGVAASTPFMHARVTLDQAKHFLGPAMYAARARELAAKDDPKAGDAEIRWAIKRASPAIRRIARRLPVRGPGRSRLDALLYQLDLGLRR